MRLQSFGGRSKVPTARPVAVIRGAGGVALACGGCEGWQKADGALGPDLEWGSQTTATTGTFSVISNELALDVGSTDSRVTCLTGACTTDQFSQIVIGSSLGDSDSIELDLIVRVDDTSDPFGGAYVSAIFVTDCATGDVSDIEFGSDAGTGVFSDYVGSFSSTGTVPGTVYRVEAVGTTIRALIDGVEILSATNSHTAAGLYAGFYSQSSILPVVTPPTWGEFCVGDL